MRVARRACETDVYHVFARGVGRQLIFEDDEDRFLFLDLMSRFSTQDGVSFIAALADNHFHLLLRAPFAGNLEIHGEAGVRIRHCIQCAP